MTTLITSAIPSLNYMETGSFADDDSIVGGIGSIGPYSVMIIGQQKDKNLVCQIQKVIGRC